MKALTQSIVDELNTEYALALYTDGEVVVVWRDPETGEIRKRPRGIAFRYAHHGYGRRLRWRWLSDPRRRELRRLAPGTNTISNEQWGTQQ